MTLTIEQKQFDDIATWMKPIKETKLPDILKGVFFMDGNPLPDDCITMYNLEWDTQNLFLLLPVFGELQWTFHPSIQGRALLFAAWLTRCTYKIQFEDETLRQARIIPLIFDIPIPTWIVSFTMSQVENSQNGDTWERKNSWFGGISSIGEYTLRRIVDKDGNYTPAFQNMLAKVQKNCLVVARE
ncbi:MAG: hypothetical protein QNJ63_25315 [Calothrix sp. MO_192.B10]|nr:hypothetical protein [Calothrix sp. MO_192.B10]